jgi:archaellum biogenesis ATPase FlaH
MTTDKCLAALGAVDSEAVMRDIMAVKHSPLPECYSWIEDNPHLKRWDKDATCRLLRIGGDPGKGKTMLMISLVQKLESMTEKFPTTYFFCQSTDSRLNSAKSVLQGLIWYLVASNPDLGDEFEESFRTRGEGPFCTASADFAELSKLLSRLLAHPQAKQINVLVDALDECDVDKDKLLKFIAEDIRRSVSKAKWLVSSRNHQDIEEELDSPDENLTTLSLELNSAHVAQAVDKFIEIQIETLAKKKKSFSVDDKEKLKQELTRKADATFLWVALVFKELEEVKARQILRRAKAFPATLVALYGRMLEQLLDQDDEEIPLCKSVMRSVVLAQRPLSLAELGVIAGLFERGITRDEDIFDLVRSCGSFVDIQDNTCYFVHQSAKDFFLNSEAGKGVFEEGLIAEHERIFCRSLDGMSRVLTKDNMCSLTYPGSPCPDSKRISESSLWPIRYSCSFWVVHLEHLLEAVESSHINKAGHLGADVAPRGHGSLEMEFSRGSAVEPSRRTSATSLDHQIVPLKNTIAARIYDFLEEKALRWIETLAVLSQLDNAIMALEKLRNIWAVCKILVRKFTINLNIASGNHEHCSKHSNTRSSSNNHAMRDWYKRSALASLFVRACVCTITELD